MFHLYQVALVAVGLVVGGGLTYGVVKLTDNSSASDDTTTTTTTTTTMAATTTSTTTMIPSTTAQTSSANGSRVVDTLQYLVLVSIYSCWQIQIVLFQDETEKVLSG